MLLALYKGVAFQAWFCKTVSASNVGFVKLRAAQTAMHFSGSERVRALEPNEVLDFSNHGLDLIVIQAFEFTFCVSFFFQNMKMRFDFDTGQEEKPNPQQTLVHTRKTFN